MNSPKKGRESPPPQQQPPQKPKRGKRHTWPCEPIPVNVPRAEKAQTVLHPRKDVFVLKVAKVGANGDRKNKMELELVTPKGPERRPPARVDTRETQCEPEPPPCCCFPQPKKKKKNCG